MAMNPSLTVRVAGTPGGIREAAAAFDGFQARHALSSEAVWPVQVALDEVLANIVGHAYEGRGDGVIDLTFVLDAGTLTVTIADDGPAIDPLALPEPDTTTPLDDRQPGGLGIYLVKQLMRRVEYCRQGGRNCLVLVHRLGAQAPAGPAKD